MQLEIPKHVKLKLETWRDIGETEVTGFFITDPDDHMKVIDAHLAEATCTSVDVDITSKAMMDFYHKYMKSGHYPNQMQIWWHTHPGNSATPSMTDEGTFETYGKDRTFNCMYILACGGDDFAQISVTDKATGTMLKKQIKIKYTNEPWSDFPDHDELHKQYKEHVTIGSSGSRSYQWRKKNKQTNTYQNGRNNQNNQEAINEFWEDQYEDYYDNIIEDPEDPILQDIELGFLLGTMTYGEGLAELEANGIDDPTNVKYIREVYNDLYGEKEIKDVA